MARVATIQDSNGDVWTGRVVDNSDGPLETAVDILLLGLPSLMGSTGAPSTTVVVNNEAHTGKEVNE